MAMQTVGIRNISADPLGRVIPIGLRRSAVFYTLVLALFLSGIVPQGFMRATDGDGMAIVLCTTDGPSEVWLTADGELQDTAPVDNSSPETLACLAITVALAAVQGGIGTLAQAIETAPYRNVLIDRRGTNAPALTPRQPRAPPIAA